MSKDCCHRDINAFFNAKHAEKQMRRYLKSGVRRNTRPLVHALKKLPVTAHSLLDIGGGIGVIPFELFQQGLTKATVVEIADGYRDLFFTEAKKRSIDQNVEWVEGDFVDNANQIERADLVTLDKVICCYEDVESLVRKSVDKASRWYAYTIPRTEWYIRIGVYILASFMRLLGSTFRPYLHSPAAIEQMVTEAGFQKIEQRIKREWLVVVYEKAML